MLVGHYLVLAVMFGVVAYFVSLSKTNGQRWVPLGGVTVLLGFYLLFDWEGRLYSTGMVVVFAGAIAGLALPSAHTARAGAVALWLSLSSLILLPIVERGPWYWRLPPLEGVLLFGTPMVLGLVVAHIVAKRTGLQWPYWLAVVGPYLLFVNAWLFVPLVVSLLVGFASGSTPDRALALPRVMSSLGGLCALSIVVVAHYLLMESVFFTVGFRSWAEPKWIVMMCSLPFLSQGVTLRRVIEKSRSTQVR